MNLLPLNVCSLVIKHLLTLSNRQAKLTVQVMKQLLKIFLTVAYPQAVFALCSIDSKKSTATSSK
jgi:hypothetical protein